MRTSPPVSLATVAVVLTLVLAAPGLAAAETLRVPDDFATIQAAIAAAPAGSTIRVGPGEHCGAVIHRPVTLVGRRATIVGCAAPLVSGLRAGFFLPDAAASGSAIRGFRFDGDGVASGATDALAFAVFGRGASDVIVEDNEIEGTVQGVTNTGGDRWQVVGNRLRGLTAFTCGAGARCGGGNGIVFQQRVAALPLASENLATDNRIETKVPRGLDAFVVAGIFVQGQAGTLIADNEIRIREVPSAGAYGVGVLVSDACCGDPVALPASRDVQLRDNRGRHVALAVAVTAGNLEGLVVAGTRGQVLVGEALPAIEPADEIGPTTLLASWPRPRGPTARRTTFE